MKKLIATALIATSLLGFTSCETQTAEVNEELGIFNTIKTVEYYDAGRFAHTLRYVYDTNTYIVYLYDTRHEGVAISPYYILNEDGEAKIAIYDTKTQTIVPSK